MWQAPIIPKQYFAHRQLLTQLILEKTSINVSLAQNSDHFFKKEFDTIFSNYHYSEYKDRLLYFHYFLNQFEKIRDKKKKDFSYFLSRLAKDGKHINGERFEILTYARLIDRIDSFSKPKDHPDFEIKFENNSVYIECGTRQTNKKGYFIQSVEQAILEKQKNGLKQKYANKDTALHVEVSNIVYNSFGETDFLNPDQMNLILDKIIDKVTYGAVVLIHTVYAQEDGVVYGHPIIKYKHGHNEDLEKLHKLMFPVENRRITPILRPFI